MAGGERELLAALDDLLLPEVRMRGQLRDHAG